VNKEPEESKDKESGGMGLMSILVMTVIVTTTMDEVQELLLTRKLK